MLFHLTAATHFIHTRRCWSSEFQSSTPFSTLSNTSQEKDMSETLPNDLAEKLEEVAEEAAECPLPVNFSLSVLTQP